MFLEVSFRLLFVVILRKIKVYTSLEGEYYSKVLKAEMRQLFSLSYSLILQQAKLLMWFLCRFCSMHVLKAFPLLMMQSDLEKNRMNSRDFFF